MLTKFSEFDVDFAKQYMRIEDDFTEDDFEIQFFIEAAKEFVLTHSQRQVEDLDASNLASALIAKMVSDLYFNRGVTGKDDFDTVFSNYLKLLRTYNI
ncbi:head-tail connector protein [Bacillus toyonensis]|uniref:head-tail connector protein n=1 Tax=Bacillus toyonensis TaxID=155322 RepID=UPI0038120951